jgi:hypothetical protein
MRVGVDGRSRPALPGPIRDSKPPQTHRRSLPRSNTGKARRRNGTAILRRADYSLAAHGAQRAEEALARVGMMNEMQTLMGGASACPYQRLVQVRVALTVDEGEAQDLQAEALAAPELAQGVVRYCLRLRVGAVGRRRAALAGGPATALAVNEVRAGKDKPASARGNGAREVHRRLVDGCQLLLGNPAEGHRQVHDPVDAADSTAHRVGIARSPSTTSAPRARRLSTAPASRTRTRVCSSSASRRGTTRLPTRPLTPVTRLVICTLPCSSPSADLADVVS